MSKSSIAITGMINCKIMIVDDDPHICEIVQVKLMRIAGQLKHGGSEELLMRTNAIQEAHREFMRSRNYASLKG